MTPTQQPALTTERNARDHAARGSMFGEHGVTTMVWESIGPDGNSLGFGWAFGMMPSGKDGNRTVLITRYRLGREITG